MSNIAVRDPVESVKLALTAIGTDDVVTTAEGVLSGVETGFKIATPEDREQASDTLQLLKRGARRLTSGLTDVFRPLRDFEALARGPYTRRAQQLQSGVAAVEREIRRWDDEAERVRRAEVKAAEEKARLAAQAAAAEAAGSDDEALPPAQVVAPVAVNTTRGAVGKDHYQRRLVAKRIVDPEIFAKSAWAGRRDAQGVWHATGMQLNPSVVEDYKAAVRLGTIFPPVDDQPIVVEGVEFEVVKTLVSGRAS